MDEIQAAVLGAKLPRLGEANRRRLEIARAYREALGSAEGIRPVAFGESYVAHLFVVRCAQRDGLQGWLGEAGIQTQIHYPVPDYLQCSQAGLERRMGSSLENTERAAGEILSLPCYPGLRDDEVEYVAGRLREWRAR